MFILQHGNQRGIGPRRTIALFLFYFLFLSFFCSSSLFASFLPSAALSSSISVMNVFMRKWDGETQRDSKQQVVTMMEKMRLFCTFKISPDPPVSFSQKLSSVVFPRTQKRSAKTWKTSCLEWACPEIASGNMVTLVWRQNVIFWKCTFIIIIIMQL